MSEIAEMCCVRIESNPFSTQKYGLKSTNDACSPQRKEVHEQSKGPNDAPSTLQDPEKEVDKMIFNTGPQRSYLCPFLETLLFQ